MAKKLTIEISGEDTNDLELALEAALDSIRRGNLSGCDSNDTGRYYFDIVEAEDE